MSPVIIATSFIHLLTTLSIHSASNSGSKINKNQWYYVDHCESKDDFMVQQRRILKLVEEPGLENVFQSILQLKSEPHQPLKVLNEFKKFQS